MIFGIKEKSINLTQNLLLTIATNILMLLMTVFMVQGHIFEHQHKKSLLNTYNLSIFLKCIIVTDFNVCTYIPHCNTKPITAFRALSLVIYFFIIKTKH